jgi:uncharacterized membrane protein
MFNRAELKERAKVAFKANYWKSVLVALVLAAISGVSFSASSRSTTGSANEVAGTNSTAELGEALKQHPEIVAIVLGAVLVTVLIVIVVSMLISTFVTNPIKMGCVSFFNRNSYEPAELDELKRGFEPSYKRNVKAMFLRDIKVLLWSLLLIVPGIMKAYSYELVPYILSEDPDMDAKEALARSEAMMNGRRWERFVLDLSFFGWLCVSVFTFGLAYVFYVGPYMSATEAEFYRAVKEAE